MGKISVCDFCQRGRFLGVELKVYGKRWGFVPGMFGSAKYKLELCHECYVEMQNYIGQKFAEPTHSKEANLDKGDNDERA